MSPLKLSVKTIEKVEMSLHINHWQKSALFTMLIYLNYCHTTIIERHTFRSSVFLERERVDTGGISHGFFLCY